MWSTERFTHLNPSQNENLIEAKQSYNSKDAKKLMAYYNTPQKAMDCQNCHIPFDFNFFFGNFLTSENKAHNNNQHDSAAIANRFYSNYKNNFGSSEESMTKYLTSNQYDPFKNCLEKMTPISDLKTGQFNQERNNHQIGKKNLFSIFEKAKDECYYCTKKDNNNNNNDNDNDIEGKDFLNSPPRTTVMNTKRRKIFECSGLSTLCSTMKKKKRLRKNNNQIKSLSVFYQKNKNWSKEQIKEISNITELTENKVYKWLWDQKNKEMKKAKFVVLNK